MKRSIDFDYSDGSYVLIDGGKVVFSIDANTLKFDSLRFYEGLYKGKTSALELKNNVRSDPFKKGNYIFSWINEIVNMIYDELKDDDLSESVDNDGSDRQTKTIPLYDFAVCAGNGDFIDDSIAGEEYITEFLEADYALRISGESMEPTIPNHSIVVVQQTYQALHNDIIIVAVDSELMCKRYIRKGRGEFLVPDNKSPEYKEYSKRDAKSYRVLGKVIGIIKHDKKES